MAKNGLKRKGTVMVIIERMIKLKTNATAVTVEMIANPLAVKISSCEVMNEKSALSYKNVFNRIATITNLLPVNCQDTSFSLNDINFS